MQIVPYSIAVDTKRKLPMSTVKVKGQSKNGYM